MDIFVGGLLLVVLGMLMGVALSIALIRVSEGMTHRINRGDFL